MSSFHCEIAPRDSRGANKSPIACKVPKTATKSDFFIPRELSTLDANVSSPLNDSSAIIRRMSVKTRIEEVMRETGWSQAELARQAGVSRSAVNQWLDGTIKTLDATIGFALQKSSGFSAQWLLLEEGPKYQRRLSLVAGGKASPEIDLVLLKDAIQGAELYLKEERRQASPLEKARMVTLLYEHFLTAGRVDAGAVRRILRAVS